MINGVVVNQGKTAATALTNFNEGSFMKFVAVLSKAVTAKDWVNP